MRMTQHSARRELHLKPGDARRFRRETSRSGASKMRDVSRIYDRQPDGVRQHVGMPFFDLDPRIERRERSVRRAGRTAVDDEPMRSSRKWSEQETPRFI